VLLKFQLSVLCFVDHYCSFCQFFFNHCIVRLSSDCGFWSPLWDFKSYVNYLYTPTFIFFKSCKWEWIWEHTLLRINILYKTRFHKVCQWLATGRWFPPGTPVSSTNKTNLHDITEILLKMALNTINIKNSSCCISPS
jgi:hypothetical protein